MKRLLSIVILLAFAAYGQQKRIAIINTVDDGEPPIGHSELSHLTDRLREIAVKTLPEKSYAVMTQQSIVAFLGSQEDMVRKCKESEGCLAKLGREISADYICQGRIGRFGEDLTIKAELYEVQRGNLVGSFTGSSKDIYGLLSVIDNEAFNMFKKMPGISGAKSASISVPSGISGLQSGTDSELHVGRRYLANFTTEPAGAVLSFDGIPNANCTKTPCKAEITEGSVRIIAVLDQYDRADTTVSIKQNNQNINIRLKPNFGILEIKPAYSEGIGKNENWSLTINGKANSSWENKLPPGKHSVKLNHKCYEDISFDVGINKGSREVFDMASHAKLKKGGLDLSAEKDGSPASEPVFVDGKRVGETPFGGSVAVCSEIEIGSDKEKVNVKLKHKKTVKYVHKVQSYTPPAYEAYQTRSTYTPPAKYGYEEVYGRRPPAEIGWQYIWDMNHIKLSFDVLYVTFGAKESEVYTTDIEWIIGVIHRWVWKPYNFITIGFGAFGGLGARHFDEGDCDDYYCDEIPYTGGRHELGAEIILGYFSLYVTERNFHRMGGGIGVIF